MPKSGEVKAKRGGKRPGSGRPKGATSDNPRCVLKQAAMTAETWEGVQRLMQRGESLGDLLERIVRDSHA